MTTADMMPIYAAVLLSSAFVLLGSVESFQQRRAERRSGDDASPPRGGLIAREIPLWAPADPQQQVLKAGLTGLLALLMSAWLALQLRHAPAIQAGDLLSLRICLAGSVVFIGRMALQVLRARPRAGQRPVR